jgi:hypothetical protein
VYESYLYKKLHHGLLDLGRIHRRVGRLLVQFPPAALQPNQPASSDAHGSGQLEEGEYIHQSCPSATNQR